MAVNTKMSLIVHFCPEYMARFIFIFHLGDDPIHYVNKYMYLGLAIDEHLDYQYTAIMVAKATGCVWVLLITKVKSYGGVPYDCCTKLYNALVQLIIDCGASRNTRVLQQCNTEPAVYSWELANTTQIVQSKATWFVPYLGNDNGHKQNK